MLKWVYMLVILIVAGALVYYLFMRYIPELNVVLIITDLILLALSVGVIIQSVKKTVFSSDFHKSAQTSS